MMRIVLLAYGYRYAVRRVCYLRYGIYYKSVVLFAVVRGYYIKSVAYIEKRGKIVFVSLFAVAGDIVAAKLVRQLFKLR